MIPDTRMASCPEAVPMLVMENNHLFRTIQPSSKPVESTHWYRT